jgi:hypothetical protein
MDYEFPTILQDDGTKRKFTKNLYKRILINGEKLIEFCLFILLRKIAYFVIVVSFSLVKIPTSTI